MRSKFPPPKPPEKKRRTPLRMLITFSLTTTMVATGGFGAFPDNPITQSFQKVISENISADFLQPFNSYMENLSVPTIQPAPKPASGPGSNSNADSTSPLGFINSLFNSNPSDVPGTETMQALTATLPATTTGTSTLTATVTGTGTPTSTGTATPTGTGTSTLIPTLPPIIIYPSSTNTPQPPPPNTSTPTNTATSTFTFTPTPVPGDFIVSNVMLNGASNTSVYVAPGATFTVGYNYQVWTPDTCPGCIIQLVTGMGAGGVGTTTCGYNGGPGVIPGVTGVASQTLTAPVTAGVYSIVIEYNEQVSCANAIAAYTGSSGFAPPQTIGTIVVNASVINVYSGGLSTGALGGRAGADAICVANKPGAIANIDVHALISISDIDSIAAMPGTYAIPTNLPLVYFGGNPLAANWADLLDGTIMNSLISSGFPSAFWWSGSEDDLGNAIPATSNCFGFTASSGSGNAGNATATGAGWMNSGPQTCGNSYGLVCIASP